MVSQRDHVRALREMAPHLEEAQKELGTRALRGFQRRKKAEEVLFAALTARPSEIANSLRDRS